MIGQGFPSIYFILLLYSIVASRRLSKDTCVPIQVLIEGFELFIITCKLFTVTILIHYTLLSNFHRQYLHVGESFFTINYLSH